jgi:O-antigen/teichoic acid export membrane protein
VGSLFAFAVATSAIVLLAGSLTMRADTNLIIDRQTPAIYLFLSFSAFLMAYIANVPYTSLRAKEASGTVVTIDLVLTAALLISNIYFLSVLKLSLYGLFLSRVIVNGIAVALILKWMRREVFGGVDWTLLRRMIRFGAPLIFSNLTLFTLNFSDRFFLQRFQSLEVVGIYAVGYKFGFLLNFLLIQPFTMMWQGRMYIVHKRPDHKKVFSRIFVLYSAVLIFATLGMAVLGPELMKYMVDPRYLGGGAVIAVVSLSYVFLGIGYFLQLGMFLAGRTGLIGMVSVAAAVVNLAANYFLILHFGMVGAAWATVLGFLAIAVGSYIGSERVCPLGLPVGRVVRCLAMAAVVYLVSCQLPNHFLGMLFVRIVLVASLPLLLWMTRCFSSDELATLHSLWKGALRMLTRPAWLRRSEA